MHNYQGNTFIGIISGCVGGLGKYLLQIHTPFLINMFGAIITAMLCGAAGVAGKEVYVWVRKTIIKRNANGIKNEA
jgi:hypothetical protein